MSETNITKGPVIFWHPKGETFARAAKQIIKDGEVQNKGTLTALELAYVFFNCGSIYFTQIIDANVRAGALSYHSAVALKKEVNDMAAAMAMRCHIAADLEGAERAMADTAGDGGMGKIKN